MVQFATKPGRKPLRMFTSLFRRRAGPDIDPLYGAIMAAALRPHLYASFGVPDTFEGRFECATLHMALVLVRLRQLPPPADAAGQALVDRFFDGLDAAIREKGIGDVAVPRRMKRFMQGFYGRVAAYEQAGGDPAALAVAIGRNVLEGANASRDLVDDVIASQEAVMHASLEDLLERPAQILPR